MSLAAPRNEDDEDVVKEVATDVIKLQLGAKILSTILYGDKK